MFEKCVWPEPKFSTIYSDPINGVIYGVYVGNVLFQGREWAQNGESAKQLAAADCLEYLGFECPYKKLEYPKSSFSKKCDILEKTTTSKDFKQKYNDWKETQFEMFGNSTEQSTDNREVEITDLRSKLNMKRNARKNPFCTEDALLFGNPNQDFLV